MYTQKMRRGQLFLLSAGTSIRPLTPGNFRRVATYESNEMR